MEGSVENPNVLDEEEEKENSAPTTTTPVSEPPTKITEKSCFGGKNRNVPDYVYRNLFQ